MTNPDPPFLLMPSGQFTCPLVNAGNLANPLAGHCNRCEHTYQLTAGTPTTTTTGAANVQGATTLTVASGTAFSTPGAFIVVDSSVDGGAEVLTASSAGSSTSIPIAGTPLRLTHAAWATVQTATLGPLGPMT